MSNVQLLVLAGAAMTSILLAAAMPAGPSLLTDRSWSDGRAAFQQSSLPDRLRR